MYAEVALDVPVRGTFHYHIPPELAGQLDIGHLVQVAFRTAQQPAIVVDLPDSTDIPQTKPVLALLDPNGTAAVPSEAAADAESPADAPTPGS